MRKVTLGALAVLVLIGLLCLPVFLFKGGRQTQTLPNGTRLTLDEVVRGRNPPLFDAITYTHFPGRWRALRPFVSSEHLEWLASKLGGTVYKRSDSCPGGVALCYLVDGPLPADYSGWKPVCVDVDGTELWYERQGAISYDFPGGSKAFLMGVMRFSRRVPKLRVRLYGKQDSGKAKPVRLAEFAVPNPYYRPDYPQWTAEALPAKRSLGGDYEVRLTTCTTGISDGELEDRPQSPSAGDGEAAATALGFEFRRVGKLNGEFGVKGVRFADATGNEFVPEWTVPTFDSGEGEFAMNAEGLLSSGENAWKVRAEVVRVKNYAPEDLWTVEKVPVPEKGKSLDLSSSTTLHGFPLWLWAVNGPGSRAKQVNIASKMGMTVGVKSAAGGRLFKGYELRLVEAQDDQGKKYTHFSSGGNQESCGFAIHPDSSPSGRGEPRVLGAKWMTLTFALTRTQQVEFLVKPQRAGGR